MAYFISTFYKRRAYKRSLLLPIMVYVTVKTRALFGKGKLTTSVISHLK